MPDSSEKSLNDVVASIARTILKWKWIIVLLLGAGIAMGYIQSINYQPTYTAKLIAGTGNVPAKVVVKIFKEIDRIEQSGGTYQSFSLPSEIESELLSIRVRPYDFDKSDSLEADNRNGYEFFELSFTYTGSFQQISSAISNVLGSISASTDNQQIDLVILSPFEHCETPINSKAGYYQLYIGISLVLTLMVVFLGELYLRSNSAHAD